MRYIFIYLFFFGVFAQAMANNLQIGTPVISDPTHISFTIQWENSWSVSSGPSNWDAVWIFIKYQDCATSNQPWQHVNVSVNSIDHTIAGTIYR